MSDTPALVTVRFTSTRASLCGVHLAGLPYQVTKSFAQQVVTVEKVAEYVKAITKKQPA